MGKSAPTYQKLRGGYYTPKLIADFLAQWAIQSSNTQILEPSCGDGIILESSFQTLIERGATLKQATHFIHGVELDRLEVDKAVERLKQFKVELPKALIHNGDFFAYCLEHLDERRFFDAIIGNPPFIRYQNFLEEHRVPAFELMRKAGLKPTRLTNTWVPFIVASAFLLNERGRLAMVIPAELLQVNYAAELRRFLSDYFQKITLITFRKLVFEGIQQEVVLLLAERDGDKHTGIRTIELNAISDLASHRHVEFTDDELKPLNHDTEKWTQYFLETEEIEFLRCLKENKNLTTTGKIIDVDVGIVTGQNRFFVLNNSQIAHNSLEQFTQPIVSRSGHLKGVLFSANDWQNNADKDLPSFLLDLPNVPSDELLPSAKQYVESGEAEKLHTGYKCSIRNRWYIVPSVWVPDAFMLRQVHAYPKIILNSTNATCTDTIHRVRLLNGVGGKTITSAFLNSLTFAFAEVTGRSYGGGVLELEPNEAEKLPICLIGAEKLDLDQIHQLLLNDKITEVLDLTDKILLIDGLGLTKKEVKMLRCIWEKLRDRRINRKHSTKTR